jgi:hypothetical protein
MNARLNRGTSVAVCGEVPIDDRHHHVANHTVITAYAGPEVRLPGERSWASMTKAIRRQ